MAVAVAKRVHRTAGFPPSVRLDDLISFGYFGLVDAATRFDPAKGASFRVFAARRIEGAIYDGIREMDFAPRGFRRQERLNGKKFSMQAVSPADRSTKVAPDKCFLDAAIIREQAKEVLTSVPREHREIFVRYFFRNERMSDIGRRIGRSESRVSQRLQAAILEVRKKLCPSMIDCETALGWHNREAGVRAQKI